MALILPPILPFPSARAPTAPAASIRPLHCAPSCCTPGHSTPFARAPSCPSTNLCPIADALSTDPVHDALRHVPHEALLRAQGRLWQAHAQPLQPGTPRCQTLVPLPSADPNALLKTANVRACPAAALSLPFACPPHPCHARTICLPPPRARRIAFIPLAPPPSRRLLPQNETFYAPRFEEVSKDGQVTIDMDEAALQARIARLTEPVGAFDDDEYPLAHRVNTVSVQTVRSLTTPRAATQARRLEPLLRSRFALSPSLSLAHVEVACTACAVPGLSSRCDLWSALARPLLQSSPLPAPLPLRLPPPHPSRAPLTHRAALAPSRPRRSTPRRASRWTTMGSASRMDGSTRFESCSKSRASRM
jgi:hypothetical protein